MELSHDTTILHLELHPKEMTTGRLTDTCMPVFIIALFLISNGGSNPNVLSEDEWVNKGGIYMQRNIIQFQKGNKF